MKQWVRFSSKMLFILILFGLLFSYAMFQGGFASWFLFFGFLPIFLYHLGLLFYPIRGWQVNRVLSRQMVRAGEGITGTITINRSNPYPLFYCVVEELSPESLDKWDSGPDKYHRLGHPETFRWNRTMKRIVFPGWRRKIVIRYPLEGVPRGEHHFRSIRLTTGDWFGFVQKTHVFPVSESLVVQPNPLSMEARELQNRFEQGGAASNVWNAKNTNIATGIREYAPGDRFSWIDWKQTARKNTVMTKEFDQEKSSDTCLILDSCSGTGSQELAFEATIEVSLSILENVKKQASSTRFLTIADTSAYFDVQQNSNEIDRLRRYLTRLEPGASVPFPMKLEEAAQQMANGLLMIVTTHLDATLKDTIQRLRKRPVQTIIYLVQPKDAITDQQINLIQEMRFNGTVIHVLTEKQLTRHIDRGECG